MISPNDFPHKLLLTNRQVVNFRKAFANKLSTDIMLSKTQLAKLIQTGRALDRRISSLWKTSLPLMKNIIQLLAKSVLISLGSTAVASAADVGIHKNILGSGTTTQIISDDKMVDIMNRKFCFFIKRSWWNNSKWSERRKRSIFSMLLGTLGANIYNRSIIYEEIY